jgi:glycosyltransferase involved in cell wall biosynthesis
VKPRLAYVRPGDFPLANESFRIALEEALPEFDVVTFDLQTRMRSGAHHRRRLARLAAVAAVRYGTEVRHRPRLRMFRTGAAFTEYRRLALETLTPGPWAATIQIQSLFDASLPGVPHLVYTDHTYLTNLEYDYFPATHRIEPSWVRREPEVYANATRVLLRSSNVRRSLESRYGVASDKLDVVYAGANAPVAPRGVDRPWNPNRIVFVGIDWERKGGPELAAAFERIRARRPEVELVVAGCDPDLPAGAIALGRVSKEAVADLLSEGGVFCLPTRLEPFGVAFVEALHAGLPIVGCDVGAVPDMVQPDVNGALVPAGDAAALETALDALVGNESRQRELGAASAAIAAERYSWTRVGERVREHVLDVVGAEPATSTTP